MIRCSDSHATAVRSRSPARRCALPGPASYAAVVLAAVVAFAGAAAAQPNFEPLERGDYQEEEELVHVLRDVEAGGAYALQFSDQSASDNTSEDAETRFLQDFRLELSSAFHRDVAATLVLEPFGEPLDRSSIREEDDPDRGRIAESGDLSINAREAYLRYYMNPNSGIVMGKHELSLGDRRGKVFHGIVPGITFDCEVGTWCMPLGAFKINEGTADWVYHWALQYTAWEQQVAGFRDALEVEIFRIFYREKDVPLGRNLGPTFQSEDPLTANETQATDDAGNPIYYDVHGHDIFGLRANWESGRFFWNLDWISSQGSRIYHRFRSDDGGITGPMQFDSGEGPRRQRKKVRGWAAESEIGWRWLQAHIGLRYLYATGDPAKEAQDGEDFLRGLNGYFELTPGSYRGTRLYFNGFDASVADGSGMGHSVNNTRMYGLFWEVDDPEGERLGYKGGIYDLYRIHGVLDAEGKSQREIGWEWDNMLTLYIHRAARIELEANLFVQGEAFSYDDHTPADTDEQPIIQTIGRFVYEF